MIDFSKVKKLIEKCENEIKGDTNDPGIFTGYSGLALYYFEKNKLYNDDDSKHKLDYYLNKTIELLDKSKNFSICSGTIGAYYLIVIFPIKKLHISCFL
jgi:hypothetical protein